MAANTWVADYQNNAAWGHLEAILKIIDDQPVENPEYRRYVGRIRYTAAAALSLKDVPPYFVSDAKIRELESAANSLHAELQSWIDTDDESRIANAYNPHLELLQDSAFGWGSGKSESIRSASASLREVTKAVENAYSDFDDRISAQRTELSTIIEQYKQAAVEHSQTVDEEFQTRESGLTTLINNVEQRVNQADAAITSIERRNSTTLESLQRQFTTAEESRAEAHANLIRENGAALQQTLSDASSQLGHYRESEETAFTEVKTRVDELKNDIEEVVGAVATTATATWYETYAKEQRKSANILRVVAIIGFIAAFAVIAASVFFAGDEEESWKTTILKSTATASLIAGAVYASKESGKHRVEEFSAKKTELTLRALDPFIATLDEDPRDRLKTEATRKVFSLEPKSLTEKLEEDDLDDGAVV